MSFVQELSSWTFPGKIDIKGQPRIGSQAPSISALAFPRSDEKPVVITFLRHCGCPFAEKSFTSLRDIARNHPDILCVAISHSVQAATDKWIEAVGGPGSVEVVVDHDRHLYGAYGLGVSSFWHVLNPWSITTAFKLGREKGIWNRPTESGTRWQTAGTFAIGPQGVVSYSHVASAADDTTGLDEAVQALTT